MASSPATRRFKRDVLAQRSEQTLSEINEFKKQLTEYNKILTKLEHDFANAKDLMYDECSDLRRRIQLETEETIAEIKKENELDINTEDSELSPELFNSIDEIKRQGNSMINTIDVYEKETASSFENSDSVRKQLANEFKEPKTISSRFVSLWLARLVEMDFDDQKMSEAAEKLKAYQLKLDDLVKKVKFLTFGNKLLNLRSFESKQKLNLSSFIYSDHFCQFKKEENFHLHYVMHETKFDWSCRRNGDDYGTIVKKLVNGNILILLTSNLSREIRLVTYNPELYTVENEKKVYSGSNESWIQKTLKVSRDRIAVAYRFFSSGKFEFCLLILSLSLEVLHQKQWSVPSLDNNNYLIMDADESYIFLQHLVFQFDQTLHVINWSLENVGFVNFQSVNPANRLYLPVGSRIAQFTRRNNNFIVSCHDSFIYIYNEAGTLLKSIKASVRYKNWPKLDGQHLICLDASEKKLAYFDFNGNNLKCVHVNLVKNQIDFDIDSNGQVYAYDRQFLYSLCLN